MHRRRQIVYVELDSSLSPGLLCSIFYLLWFEQCSKELPIMLNKMHITTTIMLQFIYLLNEHQVWCLTRHWMAFGLVVVVERYISFLWPISCSLSYRLGYLKAVSTSYWKTFSSSEVFSSYIFSSQALLLCWKAITEK